MTYTGIKIFPRTFKLFLSLLMIIMIIFSIKPIFSVAATETNAGNNTTTHDIAIVFDNSGSMYDDTDRWSQSLYAIGVFASMLDYDAGDSLGIYPMGEISVGKNGSSSSGRLEITKENIKDISKIYCQSTSDTIVAPAYSAAKYLENSSADEKWLIVMTDGVFFYDKSTNEPSEEKSPSWLESKMKEFASNDIKVQYLGFGDASVLQGDQSKNFYASNVNSTDLLAGELVDICNKIFQRNKVENISNGKFDIDVSMNSIVAFAQGKDAKINSLVDSKGNNIDAIINEDLKAGTEGTGSKKYSAPVADVSGQVVTFDACEAGSYRLNYSGSDVEVFYEPNVKVEAYLTDSEGNKCDGSNEIETGKYTVNYGLVDGVTGKDVSDSSLLSPVEINAEIENNGKAYSVKSGDTIDLDRDENTKFKVNANFLNRYNISNDNDSFSIVPPTEKGFEIKLNTDQPDNWYKLSDHDNWEPIRVECTLDGEKMTDEELSRVNLSIDPQSSDKFPYTLKILSGESAYEIVPGVSEDGSYSEPEKGGYTIQASGTYTDEYGREQNSSGDIKVEVSWHDYIPVWVWWLLAILLLLALIIFYLTRKVLPNGVSMGPGSQISVNGIPKKASPRAPVYRIKKGSFRSKGSLNISIPPVGIRGDIRRACYANFEIVAVDRRYKKSANRRIRLVSVASDCNSIQLPDGEYKRQNGTITLPSDKNSNIISNNSIVLDKDVDIGRGHNKPLSVTYYINTR